ncbi:MAG: fibro-slime domain-containing protein [Agathobacter sp.]|nr:fibro-slime domain-containing protein [Agathobacter sp.]
MRKHRIKERAFAIVLVLCMVFTMMPTNAYAVSQGDVVGVGTGLMDDKTDESDHIAWPIEIYDYHNDGMLFDFASATGVEGERFLLGDQAGQYVYMPDMKTDYYADFTKDAMKETYVANYWFDQWKVATADRISSEGLTGYSTYAPLTTSATALKYFNFARFSNLAVELIDFRDKNSDAVLDGYDVTINSKGDYVFGDVSGHVFNTKGLNGVIAGEDATIVNSATAYAAANPNWAVSVQLRSTGNVNEYEVVKVVVSPGSADAAGITWGSGDLVMVVHSAASRPGDYANWMNKVAAQSLKAGDIVTVENDTTVTVAGEAKKDEVTTVPNENVQYAVLVYNATGFDGTADDFELFLRTKENVKYFSNYEDVISDGTWRYCVLSFDQFSREDGETVDDILTDWESVNEDIQSAGIRVTVGSDDESAYQLAISHFALFGSEGEATAYGEKALVYNKHHIYDVKPESEYSSDFTSPQVNSSAVVSDWFSKVYKIYTSETAPTTGTAGTDYSLYSQNTTGRMYYAFDPFRMGGVELIDLSKTGYAKTEDINYMVLVCRATGLDAYGSIKAYVRERKGDTWGNKGVAKYLWNGQPVDTATLANSDAWTTLIFQIPEDQKTFEEIYSAGIEFTPIDASGNSLVSTDTDYQFLISHAALCSTLEEAQTYGEKAIYYNGFTEAPTAYYNPIYSNAGYGMLVGSQTTELYTSSGLINLYEKYTNRIGYDPSETIDNTIAHSGADGGIYYLATDNMSTEGTYSLSELSFDGYSLLQTLTGGTMTAGLLEPTLDEDGNPIYREEVVDYIAKVLATTLVIPEYEGGYFNYDFVRGEKDLAFAIEEGVPVDLATAIRDRVGINFATNDKEVNNQVVIDGTPYDVDATYTDANGDTHVAGAWAAILKGDSLKGAWSDCKGNINNCYDAAYFLLNNLFREGSYSEAPEHDYDYLVFNKGTCEEGREGYIFDAGFTTNDEKSAVIYSTEDKTISLQNMENKHVYYLSENEKNYTTLYPFLPITADNNMEGQTKSPYFADDGVGYTGEYGATYFERDFNYVIKSDGEFVYHKDDNLYFEFEGDDDVYLFVNGQLVLDIGGIHGITEVEIDINEYADEARRNVALAEANGEEPSERDKMLALEEGGVYSFQFFYMERHGFGANCRIHTNMRVTDPSMKVDKKAYQGGEEVDYAGSVNPQELIAYDFVMHNTGNMKLFNMSFRDASIGVTMDRDNGLVVSGSNVFDRNGDSLEPTDLLAIVTGYKIAEDGQTGTHDIVGEQMVEVAGGAYIPTDPIEVTFDNQNDLKSFMDTLEGDKLEGEGDGNSTIIDGDANEGAGLWAHSTVTIKGIYYQLTDEQVEQMYFDNILEVTADAIIDGEAEPRYGTDSHRVYVDKELVYYQWNGNPLVVEFEKDLSDDLMGVIPGYSKDKVDSMSLVNEADKANITPNGKDISIHYTENGTKEFKLQVNYKDVNANVGENGDDVNNNYQAVKDNNGNYSFGNVSGHVFNIASSGASVVENQKIATSEAEYNAISNESLWTINVLLKKVEGQTYEVAKVEVLTGTAKDMGADWDSGDIVMVVHSSNSNPSSSNWMNKVAAVALQPGNRVTVAADMSTISVVTSRIVDVEVNVVDVEDSAYVLDYGLPVILSEDTDLVKAVEKCLPDKAVDARLLGFGKEDQDHDPDTDGVQAPVYASNTIKFVRERSNEISASEGKFDVDISRQSLKYTPTALMDDVDAVYLAMSLCEAGYTLAMDGSVDINKEVRMFKKVSVLPANVVYYEDDFPAITYNTNTQNVFSSVGTSSDLTQSVDQNQEYGQDDAYANNSDKSGGSFTQITINEPGQVASFQFTGTGFELISRTNATDAAAMTVEVKDAAGTTVANIPVITEFKQADGTGNEVINQVPVIRLNDLTYGTYTVSISAVPTYAGLEEDGDGNTIVKWTPATLYIDGLRVFQPLAEITEEPIVGGEETGATSTVVTPGKNEYYKDSENGAIFTEIRDLILDGKAAVVEYAKDEANKKLTLSTGTATWTENRNNLTFDGEASYTGSKVPSANEYLMFGPNNEVYMLADDETNAALVFYVQKQQGATVHNLQLALRAIDADLFYGNDSQGTEVKVSYGTYENDDFVWSQAEAITSGTEQYYTINYEAAPYIEGKGYQIAIKVNSGMVSYSSIKSNGLDIVTLNGEAGEVPDLYYENGILKERVTGYAVDASKYPVFTSIKLQLSTDEVGDKPFSEIYVPEDESEDMDRIRYQVRDDKDLRLIGFVEDLGAYDSVSFTLTIGNVTSKELECTTAYSGLYANGTLYSTEDIYGEEGYFVAYTINNYLNYYRGQEVTITATYITSAGEEVVVERTITVE